MMRYYFFVFFAFWGQVTKASSWLAPHRFFSADREKEIVLAGSGSPTWGYWSNSDYQNLPEGHFYAVVSAIALGRWTIANSPLGIRGGGRWAYAWSENPNDRRTHSQIDPLFFGFDISWTHITGYWRLSWDELRPIYRNDLTQDLVAIGDGVDASHWALGWQSLEKTWQAHLGYHARTELSSLLYGQIRIWHKGFSVGLESWQTLKAEPGQLNPRSTWACAVNGCSPWAMAFNPTRWLLIAGFQGEHFGMELQQVLWGQNVALDTTIWLLWHWPRPSAATTEWKKLPAKPHLFEESIERKEPVPVTPVPVIDPLDKKNRGSKLKSKNTLPSSTPLSSPHADSDQMKIHLIKKKKKP